MSGDMTQLTLLCAAFFALGFASAVVLFLILRERLIEDAWDAQLRRIYGETMQRAHQHSLHTPTAIRLDEWGFAPRHRGRY